jgi:DNA-binding MarR family transcriptional regulator
LVLPTIYQELVIMSNFGTQTIGQTEKALNAILDRLLAGSDLSEPQWVALTVTVMSADEIEREALVTKLDGSLHRGRDTVEGLVDSLVGAGLVEQRGENVAASESGRELQARIRGRVQEITSRLWGDLPDEDLEVAGRVLGIVLERARVELAQL